MQGLAGVWYILDTLLSLKIQLHPPPPLVWEWWHGGVAGTRRSPNTEKTQSESEQNIKTRDVSSEY
jgi:hypothetical protein